jgi:hypothetical protein
MNYLRGFAPWIAFAAVSAAGWQWGALTGLVLAVWLLAQNRRAGTAADALILEYGMAAFFAVLTVVAFAATDSGLRHWTGALSLGWLAVIAWAGLVVGQPFTLGIARRQVAPEVWDSPVFLHINRVLTAVWAAAFTVTAIVLIPVSAADLGSAVSIPVQVAGFVVPAVFTARYPERARAGAAGRAGQGPAAQEAPDPQET